MADTDDTNKTELPRSTDALPRTSVHDTEVPLLRTGQFRPSNGFWMYASISENNALVLVAQASRRHTARHQQPPYEHLELIPTCYLLSEELWSATCAEYEDLEPLSTKVDGRYSARAGREGFHEFARSASAGFHITVGTKYRQADPWSVVFVPLTWGEELLKRGLLSPET